MVGSARRSDTPASVESESPRGKRSTVPAETQLKAGVSKISLSTHHAELEQEPEDADKVWSNIQLAIRNRPEGEYEIRVPMTAKQFNAVRAANPDGLEAMR